VSAAAVKMISAAWEFGAVPNSVLMKTAVRKSNGRENFMVDLAS
jgi:hypothetical protein